jgi:hypothetical protein
MVIDQLFDNLPIYMTSGYYQININNLIKNFFKY